MKKSINRKTAAPVIVIIAGRALVLSAVLVFVSCHGNGQFHEKDIFEQFPEPTPLNQPVEERTLSLKYPADYLIADSLLFVHELQQESFVRCFNLNTMQELSFFLHKGRGPGEMLHVQSIMKKGADSLQVYGDPQRIQVFAIADVLKGIEASDYRTVPVNSRYKVHSSAFCLFDGRILFAGTYQAQEPDEKRFYLYSPQTEKAETFGDSHPAFFQNMEITPSGKSFLNTPLIGLHPSESLFVAATCHFKSIEVYDLQSKEKRASCYYELPRADIRKIDESTMIVLGAKDQRGFNKVQCTDKYIYCFYSPVENVQSNGAKTKTVYLFVYDWSLNQVQCYSVEADQTSGYISADGRFLYCVKSQEDSGSYLLCRYELQ